MVTLDDIKKKANGNNIYLLIRFFIYLAVAVFSVDMVYSSYGISDKMYFNTILLFSAPLAIEYIFGLQTYTELSKICKTFGAFFSCVLVILSLAGLMGGININLDNQTQCISNVLIKSLPILTPIRILPFLCVVITLGDCIFAFSKEECIFYEITNDLNEFARELIKSKRSNILEQEKEKHKQVYMQKLGELMQR